MTSLLSNKTNLLSALFDFITQADNITIYSAFIKDDLLKQIIKVADGRIEQIIVRWQAEDLIKGVSDLEVFETCQENGISLFRNTSLHAKCIVNQKGDCILGSANFTNKGMIKSEHANWEINTSVNQVDLSSRVLLNNILLESSLVDAAWVNNVKELIASSEAPELDLELPELGKSDFLISSLPMCSHPELIWEIVNEHRIVPFEEMDSASHDLALYNMLDTYTTKEEFLRSLSLNFNAHPFISKMMLFIQSNHSCNYGMIVRWIQQNCQEVPIPRSWQLKEKLIVNILYDWICYFNSEYTFIRKYPRGSDIISFQAA